MISFFSILANHDIRCHYDISYDILPCPIFFWPLLPTPQQNSQIQPLRPCDSSHVWNVQRRQKSYKSTWDFAENSIYVWGSLCTNMWIFGEFSTKFWWGISGGEGNSERQKMSVEIYLKIPVTITLSPGLGTSTRSLYAYIETVCGVSPSCTFLTPHSWNNITRTSCTSWWHVICHHDMMTSSMSYF